MVRLRDCVGEVLQSPIVNFNSTMVRLRVILFNLTDIVDCIFQFHYGTIKSSTVFKV